MTDAADAQQFVGLLAVQRGRHERAVTADAGKTLQVLRVAHAASGEQRDTRRGASHSLQQTPIEALSGSDAGDVEDDDRTDTGRNGLPGDRLNWQIVHCGIRGQRTAIAKIQAERRGRAGHGNNVAKRSEGRESFESDYDVRDAAIERALGLGASRHSGVEPDSRVTAEEGTHRRVLFGAASDRIEVGNIDVAQSTALHIEPGQRRRVTVNRDTRRHLHRPIGTPAATLCMHRLTGE